MWLVILEALLALGDSAADRLVDLAEEEVTDISDHTRLSRMRRNHPPASPGWSPSTVSPGTCASTSSNTTSRRVATAPAIGRQRAPQPRPLARTQELVEHEHRAAGAHDARGLAQARERVRNNGQDEMQHRVVEAFIAEGEAHRVCPCTKLARAAFEVHPGPTQHRSREIDAHISVRIAAGAADRVRCRRRSPAHYPAATRQVAQAARAGAGQGCLHDRVVERAR